MRHRVYGSKLGRNTKDRTALFKSLVQALFIHGTITTTETKAKAIKGLVDKIINLAKSKNTQYLLQTFLAPKPLQERLVKDIVPKVSGRTSGYTSIIRVNSRVGDNTRMVRMSIIGAEELEPIKKESRIKSQESIEKPKKSVEEKAKTKSVEIKTEIKKPVAKKGKKSSH